MEIYATTKLYKYWSLLTTNIIFIIIVVVIMIVSYV